MGDESLAEKLGIEKEKAESYKKSFFDKYPKLFNFIDSTIEECKQKGYVETISGRRRILPAINSKNEIEFFRASRQAVNSKIQGSAADIIKIAMIAMLSNIDANRFEAKLLLQMHDELMFEVNRNHLNDFIKNLKRQMENVSSFLNVTLPVKIFTGNNWSQMTELDMM